MALGFSVALVFYSLYARGILPSTYSSQLFLSIILLMGYELSLDVLRPVALARVCIALTSQTSNVAGEMHGCRPWRSSQAR